MEEASAATLINDVTLGMETTRWDVRTEREEPWVHVKSGAAMPSRDWFPSSRLLLGQTLYLGFLLHRHT